MSMSYDDCQDIEKEREREDRQYEIRQRALGPIGQRPTEPGHRKPLRQLVRDRLVETALEVIGGAEWDSDQRMWLIENQEIEEFQVLADDMKTIDEEGW